MAAFVGNVCWDGERLLSTLKIMHYYYQGDWNFWQILRHKLNKSHPFLSLSEINVLSLPLMSCPESQGALWRQGQELNALLTNPQCKPSASVSDVIAWRTHASFTQENEVCLPLETGFMSHVLTQNLFLCLNLTKVRWTSCKPTSFVRHLETLKGSVLRICWRCQREPCATGYEVEACATKLCKRVAAAVGWIAICGRHSVWTVKTFKLHKAHANELNLHDAKLYLLNISMFGLVLRGCCCF